MQSIYHFRHADVGLFLNLKRHGLNQLRLTPLRLTVNFRSGKPVMAWINRAFAHVLPNYDDPERGAVTFTASDPMVGAAEEGGVFVHPIVAGTSRAVEATQVASLIAATQRKQPNARIAVLVRARSHLRFIVRELRAQGIAFQALEIDPLADRPAIQDLTALTRGLTHLADRTAWLAVLRAPWCGISIRDLFALCGGESPPESVETIWEAMQNVERLATLSADGRARVERISRILAWALSVRGRISLRNCVERTWHALGGPATVSESAALQDAASYFERLEAIERAGDLESSALLETALRDLYAAASSPARVELMTIHRAKGLEFDVVILPALDAVTKADDSPLLRAQELPELGDQALLLAPITARGDDPNPIYRWLGTMEKERARFEKGRLLYVAATRTERQLHLFGAAPTGNAPPAGTFLHDLWPMVQADFVTASSSAGDDISNPSAPTIRTRRLPLHWTIPAPLPDARLSKFRDVGGDATLQPEFEWAGEASRHIGTLVHREIERIAHGRDPSADIASHAHGYATALLELGVPPYLIETAVQRVRNALTNMLEDERGRWLLRNDRQRDAASELALSGRLDGEIVNVAIEGGGLEEFLDREVERYRPQLQRYAALMRGYAAQKTIKAALYFPLLKAWREVAV
jgi:hypothetical protein